MSDPTSSLLQNTSKYQDSSGGSKAGLLTELAKRKHLFAAPQKLGWRVDHDELTKLIAAKGDVPAFDLIMIDELNEAVSQLGSAKLFRADEAPQDQVAVIDNLIPLRTRRGYPAVEGRRRAHKAI